MGQEDEDRDQFRVTLVRSPGMTEEERQRRIAEAYRVLLRGTRRDRLAGHRGPPSESDTLPTARVLAREVEQLSEFLWEAAEFAKKAGNPDAAHRWGVAVIEAMGLLAGFYRPDPRIDNPIDQATAP